MKPNWDTPPFRQGQTELVQYLAIHGDCFMRIVDQSVPEDSPERIRVFSFEPDEGEPWNPWNEDPRGMVLGELTPADVRQLDTMIDKCR